MIDKMKTLTIEEYLRILICTECNSYLFVDNQDQVMCKNCEIKVGDIVSADPLKIVFRGGHSKPISKQKTKKLSAWKKENYEFLKKLEINGLVLDIGSGWSPFINLFPKIISVDFLNFPSTNLVCDISKQIPLASSSIDSVIITNLLEHIPSPSNLLSEINRIMKNEAKMYLSVPFLNAVHQPPHDYFRYTNFQLENMMKQSGFEIILFECGNDLDTLDKMITTYFRPYLQNQYLISILYRFQKSIIKLLEKKLSKNYRTEFTSGYMIKAVKVRHISSQPKL